MRHRTWTVALAVTLALSAAANAQATLRPSSERNSCPSGYTYGEDTFINWRVEGCQQSLSLQSNQEKRVKFVRDLEVNGMRVEVGDSGLTAVQTDFIDQGDGESTEFGRLDANDATLVLDPKIGGQRRRFVIYDGRLDLEIRGLTQILRPIGDLNPRQPIPRAAGFTASTVTLPKSGTPSVLGLRLRESLDATVNKDTGMTFDNSQLSLGSAASALLRDWTANVDIETVEGQGMALTDLRFHIPEIAIPGIGGLRHLDISYNGSRDVWAGDVDLDLGSLIGSFQLAAEINASTGAPNYMRIGVGNLNMPLGSTGILLQEVEIDLGFNPMGFGASIGVSAGPQVFGSALILGNGSVDVDLEPRFRLEAGGSLRVLASGNGEFARGDTEFILDSAGYISVSADVLARAAVLGVGVEATIGGSGEYATDRNRFNIRAKASGDLLLGPFGRVNVVKVKATFSSEGWGACTKILFAEVGVGQDWDRGLELVGCDLSDFSAPISGAVAAQNGVASRRFRVARGTKVLLMRVTADKPGPRITLRGPGGRVRLQAGPDNHGRIDANSGAFGQADQPEQYVMLRNPPAGAWTVEWPSDPSQPQITALRTARDAPAVKATVKVVRRKGDRPGRRRLRIRRTETVDNNETITVGLQTSRGFIPLNSPTSARSFEIPFDETGVGTTRIVAQVHRRGAPLPREIVLGTYRASLPDRPAALRTSCRRSRLTIRARLAKGAEEPDAWQYVVRARGGRMLTLRGQVGRSVSTALPRRLRRVLVTARPVVRGRALRGKTRSKIVRGC